MTSILKELSYLLGDYENPELDFYYRQKEFQKTGIRWYFTQPLNISSVMMIKFIEHICQEYKVAALGLSYYFVNKIVPNNYPSFFQYDLFDLEFVYINGAVKKINKVDLTTLTSAQMEKIVEGDIVQIKLKLLEEGPLRLSWEKMFKDQNQALAYGIVSSHLRNLPPHRNLLWGNESSKDKVNTDFGIKNILELREMANLLSSSQSNHKIFEIAQDLSRSKIKDFQDSLELYINGYRMEPEEVQLYLEYISGI